jgi:hypothetical protein
MGWSVEGADAVLNGQMTYPHLRSLFSTAVSKEVQGQLFSVISALETLSTAITPLILNSIYKSTVATNPRIVWMVMVGYLLGACLALYFSLRAALTTGADFQERRSSLCDPDQITKLLSPEVGSSDSPLTNGEASPNRRLDALLAKDQV